MLVQVPPWRHGAYSVHSSTSKKTQSFRVTNVQGIFKNDTENWSEIKHICGYVLLGYLCSFFSFFLRAENNHRQLWLYLISFLRKQKRCFLVSFFKMLEFTLKYIVYIRLVYNSIDDSLCFILVHYSKLTCHNLCLWNDISFTYQFHSHVQSIHWDIGTDRSLLCSHSFHHSYRGWTYTRSRLKW